MRLAMRSLWVAVLAFLAVVGLAVSWSMATAVQLLATTALIMGGTNHPLIAPTDQPPFVTSYLNNAVNFYLNTPEAAAAGMAPVNNAVAVYSPEEFFPVFGSRTLDQSVAIGLPNLHNCLQANAQCVFNNDPLVTPTVGSAPPLPTDNFAIFGYSQSSIIASLEKRALIAGYQPGDPSVPLDLVSNPMKPNGGIMMRFFGFPTIPFLGISFYGATPTDGPVDDNGTPDDPSDDTFVYPTIDVAQQYDALGGDFTARPLNLLATINSLLAYALLHGNVVNQPISDALYQGTNGDTTYYMFPTPLLPVLMPLQRIGIPTPILDAVDALLRPVIEDSYDRWANPGTPVPMSIFPIGNPIGLAVNLVLAVPVAIDNLLEGFGLGRVLGTTRPGPFGVGGPPLPAPPVMSLSTLSEQEPEAKKDDTEPPAPEGKSLARFVSPSPDPVEPTGTPEPKAPKTNETQTATVESSTPASPTAAPTTPKAEPTTPTKTSTPASTEPEKPKVRGPIEFDGPPQPPSSPGDEPSTTGQQGSPQTTTTTTTQTTNSTTSEHKDAA